MDNETSRKQFEEWISAPPYEHMCDRTSETTSWLIGDYKRYETQIAWDAWQAARNPTVNRED